MFITFFTEIESYRATVSSGFIECPLFSYQLPAGKPVTITSVKIH